MIYGGRCYHARIRVIAYIFVLTLVAVAMVVGAWAIVQTLQKPAIATIATLPPIELPSHPVELARLGPVRNFVEAGASRAADRQNPLDRSTVALRVEFEGPAPAAELDLVVIDRESGAELARRPAAAPDSTQEFAELPRSSAGIVVALALRDGAAARRSYLQRTEVALDGAASAFDCALSTEIGSLTLIFPFDENPTIVALARPDDPQWHHELRGEVAASHDGTIEVAVPFLGDGSYLVIVHDHGEHATVRPISVRGPTRVEVRRGLR